jgi:hypothetical protein
MMIIPLLAEAAANTELVKPSLVQTGLSMGSSLAIICSWQRNRSITWAIIAGLLTWTYVIYFAATRREDEKKPK